MDTMKAVAVFGPGDVRVVEDVPVPQPGEYQALVKVHACGFCNGTDFHIINGELTKQERFMGFPTVLGHEGTGEVVRVGAKVRHIQVGDRFVHPNLRPDVGNGYTKTYGGMAEYGLVNDDAAMLEDGFAKGDLPFPLQGRFPSDIDFVDAGVLLSLCESYSTVLNVGVAAGQDILIYGAGPMGTALAAFCGLLDAGSVTLVDHHTNRLEWAQNIAKVDRILNNQEQDLDQALAGQWFDIAIVAVGGSRTLIEASAHVKRGGKVASVGVLKESDRSINLRELQNNTSLHMLNFPDGEYAVMPEVCRMIQDGRIRPKDFYSHVLPFAEIGKAMELVRSREAVKVILTF